jgi:endonuclease YncB( thermonuclease family)
MDGDTAEIRWSAADVETVRVLGIDTPELRSRDDSGRSRLDARGAEARGFARGAFMIASRIELLRCGRLDVHRRTLGYFFLDGRNYSVLALEAGLARETITRYGDNGLPDEAREVLEVAGRAGKKRPRR